MYHQSCILIPIPLTHRWLRQRCLWWESCIDLFGLILSWHRTQEDGRDNPQHRSIIKHSKLAGTVAWRGHVTGASTQRNSQNSYKLPVQWHNGFLSRWSSQGEMQHLLSPRSASRWGGRTYKQQPGFPGGKDVDIHFWDLCQLYLCFLPPASANPSGARHLVPQRLYVLPNFNQRIGLLALKGFGLSLPGLQLSQGFCPEENSGPSFHIVLPDQPCLSYMLVSQDCLDRYSTTAPSCLQTASDSSCSSRFMSNITVLSMCYTMFKVFSPFLLPSLLTHSLIFNV